MTTVEEDLKRYRAAAHAMQTGVALEHERGSQDGTPKHLRVGVNTAMVDHSALAMLLMAKGVITEEEYVRAMADAMEREVQLYKERLGLPPHVHLR